MDLLPGLGPAARAELDRQLRRELHRLDPVEWCRDRLDERLWSKQAEIARAVASHRRVAVRSAQDVGKSMVASRLAAWFIDTHAAGDAFGVTTAPTMAQVEAVLWREIHTAHRTGGLAGRMNQTEWRIGGELVAIGRKPADYDPSAFQGIHALHVLVIMDEACGIPEALRNAAETLITNEASRIRAIGTPDDPASHFARICAPGSGWHQIRIDGFESPNFTGEVVSDELRALLLSPTWVEERRRSWGEDSPLFTAKVRGEFPDEADDLLIPLSWIRAAQARYEESEDSDEPVVLGVDVARFGADETVIVARRGTRAWVQARHRKKDTMETTGRVVRAIKDLGASRPRSMRSGSERVSSIDLRSNTYRSPGSTPAPARETQTGTPMPGRSGTGVFGIASSEERLRSSLTMSSRRSSRGSATRSTLADGS